MDVKDKIAHPKKRAFLAAYAKCGTVTRAAEMAEVGRSSHYAWLREDDGYTLQFEEAKSQAADALEAEARRRAVEGWDEPVYQNGKLVGQKHRYSDVLLIFLLKAAQPEKFRDAIEPTAAPSQKFVFTIPDNKRGRPRDYPKDEGLLAPGKE